MPTTADRLLRDHVRYTGDGLPNEPVGAPAPVGDPSSGVHNPSKKDLRDAVNSVTGSADAANAAADRADASADLIDSALGINTRPLFVLFLGQSNMRGNQASLGGDLSMPPQVFVWNNFTPVHPTGASPTTGNAWRPFAVGQFPSDLQVDGQYVLAMPHAIMRDLSLRTKRRIYAVTVSTGGQSIEAFLRPATRTARGWSLPSGDLDLSAQMYPQLANALAAAPGAPTFFDAVFFHQGERNMGTGDTTLVYRDKVAALMTDLVEQGVANLSTTQFVAGTIAQENPRYVDHLATLKNNLPGAVPSLKVFDSRGLITADTLHFNQHGISALAMRAVDAYQSPLDTEMTVFSSFTPVIADAATGGSAAGGSIQGIWRRQGRNVIVHVVATGITTGGMTGGNQLFIRNLPFPIADYATGAVNTGWTNFTGSLSVTGDPGATYLRVLDSVSGGALNILPVSALVTGSASIRFSFVYTTNF